MDPAYVPAPQEQKDVFGVTFEQGRNNCKIDESLLANIVTENKNLPDDAKRDMIVSLITLKYTQSNSVCYAKDGQSPPRRQHGGQLVSPPPPEGACAAVCGRYPPP